jgi:hypothetical protein
MKSHFFPASVEQIWSKKSGQLIANHLLCIIVIIHEYL